MIFDIFSPVPADQKRKIYLLILCIVLLPFRGIQQIVLNK